MFRPSHFIRLSPSMCLGGYYPSAQGDRVPSVATLILAPYNAEEYHFEIEVSQNREDWLDVSQSNTMCDDGAIICHGLRRYRFYRVKAILKEAKRDPTKEELFTFSEPMKDLKDLKVGDILISVVGHRLFYTLAIPHSDIATLLHLDADEIHICNYSAHQLCFDCQRLDRDIKHNIKIENQEVSFNLLEGDE